MIGWTNPVALWGLLLAAGPVIVHLLRRHRAARVAFPSLRFVRQAETSAVRLRLPSDLWLLLVRMSVLALAACAAAGPIVLTSPRLERWNGLTARAVVVDASYSMNLADADGLLPARLADEAARAEARSAAYSRRIDVADLAEGLRRAAAWTGSAPPARREVVVITDAQRGALDALALAAVPEGVGVRVVSVGRRPSAGRVAGEPLLEAANRSRQQRVTLTADTTAVTVDGDAPADGVRIVAGGAATTSAGERALAVAALAGTLAPSSGQPIAFRFTEAGAASEPASPLTGGWMLATALGVMDDRSLAEMVTTDVAPLAEDFGRAPWTVVLARGGRPLVSAAAREKELIVHAGASADSVFAAGVIRSVLNARARAIAVGELEIATVPQATLAGWQRPPGPVGRDAWRQARDTDARWCWALALAALALEQWMRGRSTRRATAEAVRAAA